MTRQERERHDARKTREKIAAKRATAAPEPDAELTILSDELAAVQARHDAETARLRDAADRLEFGHPRTGQKLRPAQQQTMFGPVNSQRRLF
jgi:hypothetical protein